MLDLDCKLIPDSNTAQGWNHWTDKRCSRVDDDPRKPVATVEKRKTDVDAIKSVIVRKRTYVEIEDWR